jgi:PAS domain S-box-containing protein
VSSLGGRWFENRVRKLDDDHLAALVTDVTARKQAEIELRESETYWRGLFEQMSEGFIFGTAIRDAEGRVVDWRYREVNRAWGELVGLPANEATGRTIRELFPGIEEEWISEVTRVLETRRPNFFVRQVGAI